MPVSADFNQVSNLRNNLSWNFVGQVVAKTSLLLFHIIFANHVGAGSYGEFSFIFVGGLILLPAGFGFGAKSADYQVGKPGKY